MTDTTELENDLAPESPGNADAVSDETSSSEVGASTPGSDDSGVSADLDAFMTEIAKLKDVAARAQADYKNLLARTERERLEMSAFVTEKLVSKFLPSIDNLERLIAGTPESDANGPLYEGVKSTLSGLSKALESAGISAFESIGQPLDPARHEAIVRMPGNEGEIVAEFEKGYRMGERVVRHAKVAVGDGSGKAA